MAAQRAVELVRANGFVDVEARLLMWEAVWAGADMRLDDARALFLAAHEKFDTEGVLTGAAEALYFAYAYQLFHGSLDEVVGLMGEALAYARQAHVRFWEQACPVALAGVALVRCEFDRFETRVAEMPRNFYFTIALRAARPEMEGDVERAAELAPGPALSGNMPLILPHVHGALARVYLNAGDEAGARRELGSFETAYRRLDEAEVYWRIPGVAAKDECLPALGDETLVETIYRDAARYGAVRYSHVAARGLDRIRGALALRLDLIDEAEQHYRAGLEWSERERCPVEQGRCLQGLAEIAERRGSQPDATRYLDRAAALFQEHGAQLYLRQVLAKKDILKA